MYPPDWGDDAFIGRRARLNNNYALSIPGLREEWAQLRQGGLYWLSCEQVADAEALGRQVLAGLPAESRAILVVCGGSPTTLLDSLGADQGPGMLWPYAFAEEDAASALRLLGRELRRLRAPRGQLILLLAPAACWDAFSDPALQAWCGELQRWLLLCGCSLLVLGHGQVARSCERLLACNEFLSGLAQLTHGDGSLNYQVHYWRNAFGVQAAVEARLVRLEGGYACQGESARADVSAAASDRHLYLAQRTALEGAPPLSEHWRLYDDDESLLNAAGSATAACVVFVVADNGQVGELAESLYRLRQRRGRALRLVVREIAPCLRHLDERLLLLCGASLVVPFGTGLSRFLGLLDTLPGQMWTRSLPEDLGATLKRLRPPALRGLLPAHEFAAAVVDLFDAEQGGEVNHLLLCLSPVEGLNLSLVLGQCRLRRAGDLACVAGGNLWLFLFACRQDVLDVALGHVFRLSWRELFSGYRIFPGTEELVAAVAAAGVERLPEPGEAERALPAAGPLAPARIGLAGLGRAP